MKKSNKNLASTSDPNDAANKLMLIIKYFQMVLMMVIFWFGTQVQTVGNYNIKQ